MMVSSDGPRVVGRHASRPTARALRRMALLLAAGAVPALASCSSDSAVGPTVSGNIALMAHFDSLMATAPGVRAQQMRIVIVMLAFGAPVQHMTVTLGDQVQYSAVAALVVGDDTAGHPVDSLYEVLAWRNDTAHTVLDLEVSDTAVNGLWTSDHDFGFVAARAAWSVRRAPGRCTSFADRAPPDVHLPANEACTKAAVTVSAPSTIVRIGIIGAGLFGIPEQSLASIRLEAPLSPAGLGASFTNAGGSR